MHNTLPMLATIEQTIAAAKALLAPLADAAHVQADQADSKGDTEAAAMLRDRPDHAHGGYRELTLDRKYVPGTLHRFSPRAISAYFLANPDLTLGYNKHGVNVEGAAMAILGERHPIWSNIIELPHRVQQALAMALIAETRRARAMGKVQRGLA